MVWGALRPADHTTPQTGLLEYQRGGQSAWGTLGEVQTNRPRGYLVAHVAIPAAGNVRLGWLDPSTGTTYYSRVVSVS